jgi:uncharacterized protein (UPF0548 family)
VRLLSTATARASAFDVGRYRNLAPNVSPTAVEGVVDRASIELGANASAEAYAALRERAVAQVLRYEVFAPHRMVFAVESGSGRVEAGKVIVQRVCVGPVAVEMAVRVLDVFERGVSAFRETGFQYVTPEGHTERGVASFFVREALDTPRLSFHLETVSGPGHWLARLGSPLARWLQVRVTKEALRSFQQRAEGAPPG